MTVSDNAVSTVLIIVLFFSQIERNQMQQIFGSVWYTMLLQTAALLLVVLPDIQSARYSEIQSVEGQSRCPCLTTDQIPRPKNTSVATESYGVGCGYHDAATTICEQSASQCSDENNATLMDCDNAWCFMAWCYVGRYACNNVLLHYIFIIITIAKD